MLLTDLGRLSDRVGGLQRHFAQTTADLDQIQTSIGKITPRAEKLREMDFGDN